MSSSSSAGSNTSNIITTKSLSLSTNTLLSTNNNNNNFNGNYDTISVGSSTSSSSANGGNFNSNKFVNSFKSLFDIFDPNNRGYIDLNELELLGANQNEILNDIICYLKQEKESLTTSLQQQQQQQSIPISSNTSKTPSKTPTNVNKTRNRSSLYYQTKIPYFVTFETFVNAADAVLKKRKLAKTQQKQPNQPQSSIQQFQTPIITQQQQQTRLQYKSAIATTTSSTRATTQRTNHQKTTLSDEFNSNENLAQSTTSNLSNSTSSNSTTVQHTNANVNGLNGPTSTNVINNANSCDLNILLEQETCLLNEGLIELNKLKLYYEQKLSENELKKANILKLKHQNLFSIDKMLLNLKEITNLNSIFNNFVSKHLNTEDCDLYKIDKENLNLDYLLNANNTNNTITTNSCMNTPSLAQSSSSTIQSAPVDDTNNLINTYNTYITEKQNRIEYLQNQKSMLIRKLFEMKSMSNNNNDSTKRQTIACPNITDKTEFTTSSTSHLDDNTKHEDFLFE